MTDSSLIQTKMPPEITLKAGEKYNLNLYDYFEAEDDSLLQFIVSELPNGFTYDEGKNVIHVTAPILAFDAPYIIAITAIHNDTDEQQTVYWGVRIIGSNSQELAVTLDEALVQKISEETSSKEYYDKIKMLKHIEYIISQHFPVVYIYDAYNPPQDFGELLEFRKAECGFSISHFDNCIVITSGEMAFEEYGNRNRLLKSLKEVFAYDLPKHDWSGVCLSSTTLPVLCSAWVAARVCGVAVSEEAPIPQAEQSYQNVMKVVDSTVEPVKRLVI